jgi:hypothetical protein
MKTMKIFLALLACVLLFGAPTVKADTWSGRYISLNETCDATGVNGVYLGFVGARRQSGGVPHITTANVTSDLATATFQVLSENGDSTTTDAAYSSGGKILPVTATSSFQATTAGAGSYVAIYDNVNHKFETNRVSSITAATSLNLVRNTDNDYASGATVYELVTTGQPYMLVGATTKDWPNISLIGEAGKTLGLVVNGTSSCSINAGFGGYLPE